MKIINRILNWLHFFNQAYKNWQFNMTHKMDMWMLGWGPHPFKREKKGDI